MLSTLVALCMSQALPAATEGFEWKDYKDVGVLFITDRELRDEDRAALLQTPESLAERLPPGWRRITAEGIAFLLHDDLLGLSRAERLTKVLAYLTKSTSNAGKSFAIGALPEPEKSHVLGLALTVAGPSGAVFSRSTLENDDLQVGLTPLVELTLTDGQRTIRPQFQFARADPEQVTPLDPSRRRESRATADFARPGRSLSFILPTLVQDVGPLDFVTTTEVAQRWLENEARRVELARQEAMRTAKERLDELFPLSKLPLSGLRGVFVSDFSRYGFKSPTEAADFWDRATITERRNSPALGVMVRLPSETGVSIGQRVVPL